MSALARLSRALNRAAREWGEVECDGGFAPWISPEHGACVDRGAEPYLRSFRVRVQHPAGGPRTFTVTVMEDDPR